MSRPKALRSNDEVRRMIALWQELGLPVGAVDIRADGVTIHPPAPNPPAQGNAFDLWKSQNPPPRQDTNRDRPAPRQ